MMKVEVWGRDLGESYFRSVGRLSPDAIDGLPIPKEPIKGYFPLDDGDMEKFRALQGLGAL